jgi:hypothetical protein
VALAIQHWGTTLHGFARLRSEGDYVRTKPIVGTKAAQGGSSMRKLIIILTMSLIGAFAMGTALATTLNFTDLANGDAITVQIGGGGYSNFSSTTSGDAAYGSFKLGGTFGPTFTVQANIYQNSLGGQLSDSLMIISVLGNVSFIFLSDPLAIPWSGPNVVNLVRDGTSQLIVSNVNRSGLDVYVRSSMQSVPEPSATVLLGLSLFALVALGRTKVSFK